jgi:hypothetical protein
MTDLTTTEFFVKNLEYLESPQYLRKQLFPKHSALRFASLMNPLDTPHHMRVNEWSPYREGVVINRPVKDMKGSWVNIGLYKDCQVNIALREGTRVTVKLDQTGFDEGLKCKFFRYLITLGRLHRSCCQLVGAIQEVGFVLGLRSASGILNTACLFLMPLWKLRLENQLH